MKIIYSAGVGLEIRYPSRTDNEDNVFMFTAGFQLYTKDRAEAIQLLNKIKAASNPLAYACTCYNIQEVEAQFQHVAAGGSPTNVDSVDWQEVAERTSIFVEDFSV